MPDYELHTVLPKVQNARFNFTLYKGKSENQVLITQKKPTSKLIAEIDQKIGGGTRVTKGVCYFENGEFIFATKAEVAPTWEPMTTKILKEHQCSKYLPVVYRKLAENETDEVEGAEGEAPGTPEGTTPPPPPNGGQPVPPTATAPNGEVPPPPPMPPSPEVEKIRQSSLAVWAKLKTVLTDHPELRGEFGPLVANFNAALHANNAAAAKEALVAVLLKLKAHGGESTATTPPPPVAKATGPTVLYTQSRLEWQQARQKVMQELRKLEDSIIAASADEELFEEIASNTSNLYGMMEELDARLDDKLDAALNAETPEKRQGLHTEAQKIVKAYLNYINGDPLIQEIDSNAFVNVAIRSTLTTTLEDLGSKLSAPVGLN